ncbi:hypothetical protein PG994_012846 [Apiospora phragmitis]|uniref:Uncharacterized protein n=1 Tax=Apiospora phragmitis TaxID=2905665 RepID=A0ABR1T9G6_9PEZI
MVPFDFKLATWAFCLAVTFRSWYSIQTLRNWMDSSQWLEREARGQNVENDINTVGQLAPLIALGATAFILLDKLSYPTKKAFLRCVSPATFPERVCCADCDACKKCGGGRNGGEDPCASYKMTKLAPGGHLAYQRQGTMGYY